MSLAAIRPFSIWVVARMGIRLFNNNGWPHEILDYIILFFIVGAVGVVNAALIYFTNAFGVSRFSNAD